MSVKELQAYKEELEKVLLCLEKSHAPQVRSFVAQRFHEVVSRLIIKIQKEQK